MSTNNSTNLGKYRVIAELGHGGMADVYLAVVRGPVGFNKLQVIKQLRPHLAENPEFLDMFLDEARLAARLNHPNVVQTNEVVEENNRYFIAMEYLDGQSFDRVLRRAQKDTRLTLSMRVRVLADVLAGLQHAHELADFDGTPLKVVHRDVTPHNVFVTYEGQVKVVDFGIAKAANCSAETRTGVLKGKVAFMAPEQARGDEVDCRADVFSVGLMLWECISGQRPWKGLTDIQILSRLALVRTVKADVPPELERICSKATAVQPFERYSSAAEMQAELERYLDALPNRPTTRELGNLVSEMFQDKRTEIRALVEAQLRDSKSMPTGEYQARTSGLIDLSPSFTATATHSSQHTPASISSLHGHTPSYPSDVHEHSQASHTGSRPGITSSVASELVPQKGGGIKIAMIMTTAALIGLIAVVLATRGGGAAAAAPASSVASLGEAQLAELKVRASPPEARLFLDDAPLPSNPFTAKFPKDGASHRLRAEAPGFVSKTELVTLSGNVDTEVRLEKVAEASEPAAKGGVPTPAGKGLPTNPGGSGKNAATTTTAAATATTATAAPPPPDPNTLPTPKNDKNSKPKRALDTDDPWAK
jgi:serine/threonine-protein kinase